jgi:hypothetical protein
MFVKSPPLLCELHAHSTWSDGAYGIPALVDLYGRTGFDVLAVTDHTVDTPGAGHGRTARFAADWRELRGAVDRFELVHRDEVVGWVAKAGLPAVASGDFHRIEHLAT